MTQRENNIAIFGRKTFFIMPDTDLITSEHMERLCENGLEAYIINNDGSDLKNKVEAVIRTFPDSIMYFNIDAHVNGINWESYIRDIKLRYPNDVLVGVIYRKNETKDDAQFTNYYVRDLGVQAGCIGLQAHQDFENVESIRKTMEHAWAKGRRNYIRVECDENSAFDINFNGQNFTAKLEDINLTHCRCTFPDENGMRIFDKIRDARVNFNGTTFISDAVLIMKRVKDNIHSYIFMFIHQRPIDLPDLEEKTERSLNSKIYKLLSTKMQGVLRRECH